MKTYQEPVTEIIEIEAADVITTSVATDRDDYVSDGHNPIN